jgi:hypothetical protein
MRESPNIGASSKKLSIILHEDKKLPFEYFRVLEMLYFYMHTSNTFDLRA